MIRGAGRVPDSVNLRQLSGTYGIILHAIQDE